MDQLTYKRHVRRGAAAAFVIAAFLTLAAAAMAAAPSEPIDTAATVTMAQCYQCHPTTGRVDVPGLIFDHGNHLAWSCETCHPRLPHREGSTERVPMQVCFACHGVQHGPQGELATGECADCHTPSFELRPRNHTPDWAGKPHVDVAKAAGVNSCMMCHDAPEDCDACHKRTAPDVPPMPKGYHSVFAERPKDPSVKMYPDNPVSMSQCVYCHPDIDSITPGRLIFAHTEHLRRQYRCESCHERFPHQQEKIEVPDMLSCYRCHGMQHASQGRVASDECEKCHPSSFNLVPQNHTAAFIAGEHKKLADKDPAYCAMCHKPGFCVDCHTGVSTSENAPSKAVIPADHRKVEWRSDHGGRFLEGKGACASCHDAASCTRCHKTTMPHPVDWIEDHNPDPGIPVEDCYICHVDRAACQDCHHANVKSAELIAANCTGCHDEMKQTPATSIKNKGFAEHAVHFNVKKTKGEPYHCDDCHVGFGSVASAEQHQNTQLQQAGHDVRLCYGCHGALDIRNVQIAPYDGADLCRRCHTELNI